MLSNGKHFGLDRDLAKRLFGCKDDESLLTFVEQLDRELTNTDRACDCGESAEVIHRALSDGTLDPAGGEFPLNHCILGGRKLYQGDESVVALIRPDMVPHVAAAVAEITEDEFQLRFDKIDHDQCGRALTSDDCQSAWQCLQVLRQFFQAASTDRLAVLFTTLCRDAS